jgi:glycosyltransferase involved in cell wall biosynthesis
VDPAGVLAAIAGHRLRLPAVVTCDSGEFTALPEIDYGLQRSPRGHALVRLACGLASRVHVTSMFMESLARAHGLHPVRIPIGIDVDRVLGRSSMMERRERPPWRLLQIASLNRVKDVSTLLGALAIVRHRLDVRLDLVGVDTFGDGRLQREAAALGVAEAVSFHGFLPSDALPPLRAAAHLYVQSSRHEAAGISVMEAAAAGLPIVGTRVGYVSDWAPHAAVAVPPADPGALAAAIADTLQNPGERLRLAAAAREFALAHDVDWTAAALTRLYEDVART